MTRLLVEAAFGDMRGGDALIARLELEFDGQFLQLVADHRAVGHPERQATTDRVVEGEQVEFPAEFPVVAFQGEFMSLYGFV